MLSLINIEKLNGTNFKAWKQKVEMHLGMLEFDIAFKLPRPSAMTDDSTSLQRDSFAKWERANQISILIMQNAMEDHIRGGISVCDLAKEYMARAEEKYKRNLNRWRGKLVPRHFEENIFWMQNLIFYDIASQKQEVVILAMLNVKGQGGYRLKLKRCVR